MYISFILKKYWPSSSRTFFEMSSLYHISLFLTVRFVIFQINTKFQINHLKKYFYTLHLSLIFKKKECSVSQKFRETCTFYNRFKLSQWVRCATFQTNTSLISLKKINIFGTGALYPSFILRNNCCCSLKRFFETFNFLIQFHYFHW